MTKPPASEQRCRQCLGERSYYSGPVIVECFRCGGSGQEPSAAPPEQPALPLDERAALRAFGKGVQEAVVEQPARGGGVRLGSVPCPLCKEPAIQERGKGLRFIVCNCLGKDVVLLGTTALSIMSKVDDAPGKDGA